jgi:hypothetical protein
MAREGFVRWTRLAAALLGMAALGIAAAALRPVPAAAGLYRIAVNVALSPKAAEALKSQSQNVTLFAFWEGVPIASKLSHAGDDGVIGLGNEELHLTGTHAVVRGRNFDRKHLAWVKDVLVLINVYSSGRPGQDNILDCTSIEISAVQKRPVKVFCKLIGEDGS